jgi:N-dimethylarginine dimethylaminohydrolase
MKSVLLCPLTYFDVRDVKNPYMQDADAVDHEKALDQWEALRRAARGLRVKGGNH